MIDVNTKRAGIFRGLVRAGEDVRYGNLLAEILDPYDGTLRETILASPVGIVVFAHTAAFFTECAVAYRLIHSLHEETTYLQRALY